MTKQMIDLDSPVWDGGRHHAERRESGSSDPGADGHHDRALASHDSADLTRHTAPRLTRGRNASGAPERGRTPHMTERNAALSRRRFLQGSTAAASVLGLLQGGPGRGSQPAEAGQPPKGQLPKRPNFLVLMCDEMRFPPLYESAATKAFRQQYL